MLKGNLVVQLLDGSAKRVAARRSTRFARVASAIETLEPRVLLTASTGQLFVASLGSGVIGEYDTTGTTINASFLAGLPAPQSIAVSGSDMFVASLGSGGNGTIGEYTTAGATVNAKLVTGLNYPYGVGVSGSDVFVVNDGNNTLGEYTTAGATVNAALITGLNGPYSVVASDSDLFITNVNTGTISEYTTAGNLVNASLVSGLNGPEGLCLSGTDLYVTNYLSGTVGEYTTAGDTVNATLVSGLESPYGIVVSGSNLYVTGFDSDTQAGWIGQYTTAGVTVNATLVTGLTTPKGMALFSTALPAAQLAFGQQPGNTAVGGIINPAVVVDVEDANGDIIANDNSSVTLTVASGPGVLGGNVTVNAVNGVATFANLTLSKIGNYTLQSTDGSLTAAISSSFVVNNTLAFVSQPGNVAAGIDIYPPIYVAVENGSGNVIIGDTSRVTLAVAGGPGSLQGTLSVNAANGLAKFNDIRVSAPGNYTLTATDGTLLPATSVSFTVRAGNLVPVYRLFSPITVEHLYTDDANENSTLATRGWIQEGIAWYEYDGLATVGGVTDEPLYRLYDPLDQTHMWTTDVNEYNTLTGFTGVWIAEGISGYVFPSAVSAFSPLYRMSYPFAPAPHFLTANENEYDLLASLYGWTKEGVIGYVLEPQA